MAGSNKVLKDGQVLFKAGDKSDGMYLIRRGELRVYLEQDGKEVVLASIGEGGMIGEMALFDNQPRSASVKAASECEVTLISTEDFAKLMKQIPKWFVGLMSALSGRLRQTNERLKKIESEVGAGAGAAPGAAGAGSAKGKPFQATLRILNVLVLLWHKDGAKDGKDWTLPKAATEKTLIETFGEDPEKLKLLFEVLIKAKLLTTRQDSYKNVVLAMANRAALNQLATFIAAYVKSSPASPCPSEAQLAMLRVLERLVMASPYDAVTCSLADLEKEGRREGLTTTTWSQEIKAFAQGGEEVKLVRTSTGPGLKTTKKDVTLHSRHFETLAALYKANLA